MAEALNDAYSVALIRRRKRRNRDKRMKKVQKGNTNICEYS